MLTIVLLVVFAALMLVGLAMAVLSKPGPDRSGYIGILFISSLLLAGTWFFGSFTSVSARSVAVETLFGKQIGGPLDSGVHFIRPWAAVEEFSLTTDTSDREGANDIDVRIAGGAVLHIGAKINYHLERAGAIGIWRSFTTYQKAKSGQITSFETDAFNQVFGRYRPEQVQDGEVRPRIESELTEQLRAKLATLGVSFDSVTLTSFKFEDKVQAVLDDFVSQQQKTRTAEQQKLTAQKLADANKEIQRNLTPAVLQQRCLDLVQQSIEKKVPLPAGFNCLGGGQFVTTNR